MAGAHTGLRVIVDQDLCMGSGYCVAQHPELFSADADGTAVPRAAGVLNEDQVANADEAANLCPASAIEVVSRD
ncbi:ferredoxin [Mycobacteroides chelonae]|uniref:ferredoxin n=1 Tax=Mycobacteroides chelonae TaxID=1774 RepID=UPI003AB01245